MEYGLAMTMAMAMNEFRPSTTRRGKRMLVLGRPSKMVIKLRQNDLGGKTRWKKAGSDSESEWKGG